VQIAVAPGAPAGNQISAWGNANWRGTISVRNQLGQLVRLVYVDPERVIKAGQRLIVAWDEKDDRGQPLPDGAYAVRVEAIQANPDHSWGGRYFEDHYLAVLLDPRGDCFYLAGINSRETLFTHDEYPEALLRRFDFDGLPLGPEIPLEAVQLEWGSFRPTMDIHGDVYLVDGFQNVASGLPRLYKIDGRTGRLLWTSWGIIDNATGKQRAVDGTVFDGRKVGLTGHAHLWDTDSTVWVGAARTDDAVSQVDARTGTLLKRVKIPLAAGFVRQKNASNMPFERAEPGAVRVAPDGTLVTASTMIVEPVIKLTPDSKVLWQLQSQDLNHDGDLFDPPDSQGGWGELLMLATSDVTPLAIDVEGNSYGTAPAGPKNRTNNGLVKYDLNGQLLLWADFCSLGPLLCDLDVSADGRLIAANYKHSMHPMVNQADSAQLTVRIQGSPAKRQWQIPETWQSDIADRLGDGPAAELNRGRLALARRQFPAAINHLRRAAGSDDPAISGVAHALWAQACRRQGDLRGAIAIYQQCASRWSQETARTLIQAAQCQIDLGEGDQAVATLERAQHADAEGFWAGKAMVMRTALLRRLGQAEDSVAVARQAADCYPLVRPNLRIEEAEGLLALKRPREAVDALLEIVRHYPIWSVEFPGRGPRRSMRLLAEAMKQAGIQASEPAPYAPQPGKPGDWWPDLVIGQETLEDGWYMHSDGGLAKGKGIRYALYPRTIAWPIGLASDGQRLVVAGYNAGRICVYDPVPTENFAPSSLRVGERIGWDYMTLPGGMAHDGGLMRLGLARSYRAAIRQKQEKERRTADMTMNPVAVCGDGKTLFVTDSIGNRVLVFNRFPERPDVAADFVLGQPNLLDCVPNFGGLSPSSLKYPYGAHCDGKYLWVADRGNHRVLRWTLPVHASFQPADLVLGQKDLRSAERNGGGLSARGFNRPGWVYSDARRLVISDTGNHRVLLWHRLPQSHGQPADLVLGQKDFRTTLGWNLLSSGYIGKDSFAHPTGVLLDEGRLYVCDSSNNRVLVWNRLPTSNGQPADALIGQPDLDARLAPVPSKTWFYGYLPDFQHNTAGNLYFPIAVAADRQRLYLSDYNRCRVLIYNK
jgi:DNA-binding beta-propeller fold protein YncE